jgi:hypothetical protein
MSQVTYYVALPFRYVDGEMVAGEPQECRDAFKARSVAAVLASNAEPELGGIDQDLLEYLYSGAALS